MIARPLLPYNPISLATWLVVACLGAAFVQHAAAQELRFAHLGTCPLESGEVIEECVLGYRTVGELDADGSNAVLLATWGGGTSEQKLASDLYVGPDGWVDPEKYFVVVVDAFGNGVSSSPSNSHTQPGAAFPEFTIRDIVHAQHRLLTEVLGLERLHAVTGLSLGGFITYEWATTYPDFMERTIPVVATPRRSTFDLLLGTLPTTILKGCGAECDESAREAITLYHRLMLRTPEHWNRALTREDVPDFLEDIRQFARTLDDTDNRLRQLQAAERFDITEPFDGSMDRATAAVQAEMLIVVNTHDLLTTPEPSREFAELAGARLLETGDDCGHQTFLPGCSGEEITAAIRDFLGSPRGRGSDGVR